MFDMTDLFDFGVQFSHLFHSTSVIIRTTKGIHAILNVGTNSKASATCMSADDSSKTVTFRGDPRQVCREFFEVQLFLVTELEDCTIGL